MFPTDNENASVESLDTSNVTLPVLGDALAGTTFVPDSVAENLSPAVDFGAVISAPPPHPESANRATAETVARVCII